MVGSEAKTSSAARWICSACSAGTAAVRGSPGSTAKGDRLEFAEKRGWGVTRAAGGLGVQEQGWGWGRGVQEQGLEMEQKRGLELGYTTHFASLMASKVLPTTAEKSLPRPSSHSITTTHASMLSCP